MNNLQRWAYKLNTDPESAWEGCFEMVERPDGEYVRYDDVKELLPKEVVMTERIVPIEELAAETEWEDMAQLAVIFNHEVIEDKHGTWRWKKNQLMSRIQGDDDGINFHTPPEWRGARYNQTHKGAVDLNSMTILALRGEIPLEEYMQFHMQIGHSLGGYSEVFGQREVTEYKLEYLSPPPEDHDFDNHYYQTAIDYMCLKYAGQILKL